MAEDSYTSKTLGPGVDAWAPQDKSEFRFDLGTGHKFIKKPGAATFPTSENKTTAVRTDIREGIVLPEHLEPAVPEVQWGAIVTSLLQLDPESGGFTSDNRDTPAHSVSRTH